MRETETSFHDVGKTSSVKALLMIVLSSSTAPGGRSRRTSLGIASGPVAFRRGRLPMMWARSRAETSARMRES
eukprot:2523518-Rhodomonas_salina.2